MLAGVGAEGFYGGWRDCFVDACEFGADVGDDCGDLFVGEISLRWHDAAEGFAFNHADIGLAVEDDLDGAGWWTRDDCGVDQGRVAAAGFACEVADGAIHRVGFAAFGDERWRGGLA